MNIIRKIKISMSITRSLIRLISTTIPTMPTIPTQSLKYKTNGKFQYVSDIHFEYNEKIKIIPDSENLIIAGDLGNPFNKGFFKFFSYVSPMFKKIIFVAGNHDLHESCVYNDFLYNYCKNQINDVCRQFDNVYFLDNDYHIHNNDIVIIGTPLWTHLSSNLKLSKKEYELHNKKHFESVKFIEDICKKYENKKIIVVSHYVPTLRLIEGKYKLNGDVNSKWVTNLENVMSKYSNINAWICGHTHSVQSIKINCLTHSVNCMINAHGYNSENSVILTKTFDLFKN